MSALDLDAIEEKWLQQCGPCDGGLPMGCSHPTDDYRPVIFDLIATLRERDNTIARVRKLHQPLVNSTSALYSKPLCACSYEYPCATIAALDPQEAL